MAEAGTATEKAASKRRIYKFYSIDIGSGRKDVVAVRADVADYFNMADETVATGGAYKVIERANTGRELYVDLGDTTPVQSANETINRFALPKRLTAAGGGKIIVVPTALMTTKKNIRTARIHFPSKANLAAISNFLFAKCVKDTPAYFITPRGVRRAVVEIAAADINANEDATPAAATS